ncbi:hypothetical protein ARAF_2635 [Arsenophonus endosymbiont of Aleurodicus floccissimus]|uniref:head-tail connector protein n=1 Tax=Arsenophonus endosymbiont of Aleurodicus floccissimus TaxID=2152761 RepID=UPI000E6AFB0B|nr:head-tail connector protein [Arsenophonus endosymbiont of Aleurodicus floccissimus]SPP32470.1 hypothetical protein ARAF_2635 [Arsenophonus endosymbiont of Aleurodicus floccissimus]
MFIDKEQIKQQCRIELDDNNEDVLLERYIAAVEQKTIAHLNFNLYEASLPKTDPNSLGYQCGDYSGDVAIGNEVI